MHVDTARKKIRELEAAGYIIRHERTGRTNLYELVAEPPGQKERWENKVEARQKQREAKTHIPLDQMPTPPLDKTSTPPLDQMPTHDDSQGREKRKDMSQATPHPPTNSLNSRSQTTQSKKS